MSRSALNSANKLYVDKNAYLRNLDITEREYEANVNRFTGPANSIIDTIGNAVDIIKPTVKSGGNRSYHNHYYPAE